MSRYFATDNSKSFAFATLSASKPTGQIAVVLTPRHGGNADAEMEARVMTTNLADLALKDNVWVHLEGTSLDGALPAHLDAVQTGRISSWEEIDQMSIVVAAQLIYILDEPRRGSLAPGRSDTQYIMELLTSLCSEATNEAMVTTKCFQWPCPELDLATVMFGHKVWPQTSASFLWQEDELDEHKENHPRRPGDPTYTKRVVDRFVTFRLANGTSPVDLCQELASSCRRLMQVCLVSKACNPFVAWDTTRRPGPELRQEFCLDRRNTMLMDQLRSAASADPASHHAWAMGPGHFDGFVKLLGADPLLERITFFYPKYMSDVILQSTASSAEARSYQPLEKLPTWP